MDILHFVDLAYPGYHDDDQKLAGNDSLDGSGQLDLPHCAEDEVETQYSDVERNLSTACSSDESSIHTRRASVVAPLLGNSPILASAMVRQETTATTAAIATTTVGNDEHENEDKDSAGVVLEDHDVVQIMGSRQVASDPADTTSGLSPMPMHEHRQHTDSQAADYHRSFDDLTAQFIDIDGQLMRQLGGVIGGDGETSSSSTGHEEGEEEEDDENDDDRGRADDADVWNMLIGPVSTTVTTSLAGHGSCDPSNDESSSSVHVAL